MLLKEFTFKNCYSFKDEVTLSMVANYNMKDNLNFVTTHGDGGNEIYLNPVAAIYGSNAGGKTNIFKALLDAVDNISKREMHNIPFMYPDKKDYTFSHKLVIVHDDTIYHLICSKRNFLDTKQRKKCYYVSCDKCKECKETTCRHSCLLRLLWVIFEEDERVLTVLDGWL